MNSVIHGLAARTIVLSVQDETRFDQLRESYHRELQPGGQLETDLVDQIVAARWHLERAGAMESALLDLEILKSAEQIEKEFEEIDPETRLAIAFRALCDQTSAMAVLHRYETCHRRTFERTLRTLREIRTNPLPPPPPGTTDHKPPTTGSTPNLPSEPNPTNEHPAPAAPAGSFVKLYGLNRENSDVEQAGLRDFAPVVIWQDQLNSLVKYATSDGRSTGKIDASCGSIDSPCSNSYSTAPQLEIWATPNTMLSGVVYQPRGSWTVLQASGVYRGPIQLISGALSLQGSGELLMSSLSTPFTLPLVTLVE